MEWQITEDYQVGVGRNRNCWGIGVMLNRAPMADGNWVITLHVYLVLLAVYVFVERWHFEEDQQQEGAES